MKTAQQIIDDNSKWKGGVSIHLSHGQLEDILKEARKDGRKQGMLKAAKICNNSLQLAGPYFKNLILHSIKK